MDCNEQFRLCEPEMRSNLLECHHSLVSTPHTLAGVKAHETLESATLDGISLDRVTPVELSRLYTHTQSVYTKSTLVRTGFFQL